jgi:hypothetical protein
MLTEMREAAAGVHDYPTFTEIFLDLGDKALSRHDEQGKLSLDEPISPHSGRYQVQG